MKDKHTPRQKKKIGEKLMADFQFKFSTAALLGIVLAMMLCVLLVRLLNSLFQAYDLLPIELKFLVLAVVLGLAVAVILNRAFIRPLAQLAKAMQQVAAGDFTIQLECKSSLSDIKKIYSSFNLMVKALASTETLQSDFVSNVSHEFKTPINAIEGYASLLQDSELPREQQMQYVGKIMFNTKRLSDLVGNILLLSKVDNNSIRPKAAEYRLDEQIRQSVFALERKWTEKNIDFDIEMDEVEYFGYESFMQHVWTNLIDNAIKFNPYGGQIKLRLAKEEDVIRFSVADTGPGIPEDAQASIFRRFYQVDSSHKSEGNGLGLALAKRIVTASGGTIEVVSELGAGACFVVQLPVSVENTAYAAADMEEKEI